MENNQSLTMPTKKCDQLLCGYSETGICMDGNGENCTFLKDISVIDANTPVPSQETSNSIKKSDIIRIASGEDLTDDMFGLQTYEVPTKLILLIGEPGCGKSTLFASLFDRFQKGAFGNYSFSATQTPIGFERRAHHARVVSQNISSKTERTNIGDFTYLHIVLENKNMNSHSNILFADISGEKYRDARASDTIMQSIKIIHHSSQLFLIANGELLLDGRKHDLRKSLIQFMDRAIKNDSFVANQIVHLLITKWDRVLAANKENEAQTFLTDYLKNKYPNIIGEKTFQIASRSVNPDFPAGSGLEAFLDQCISKEENSLVPSFETKGQGNRIFQNFQSNIDG